MKRCGCAKCTELRDEFARLCGYAMSLCEDVSSLATVIRMANELGRVEDVEQRCRMIGELAKTAHRHCRWKSDLLKEGRI